MATKLKILFLLCLPTLGFSQAKGVLTAVTPIGQYHKLNYGKKLQTVTYKSDSTLYWGNKVDSIWKVSGKPYIYFTLGGTKDSVKDSIGGGSDSAVLAGYGLKKTISSTAITIKLDTTNQPTYVNRVAVVYAHMIYFMGNSITIGFPSYYNCFPYYTVGYLHSGWTYTNLGVGGNTTAQMVSRLSSVGSDCEYFVLEGGVNDVRGSVFASTTIANIQSMVTTEHNAGRKVVVINVPPINGMTSAQILKLDSINTWESTTMINADYKINIHSVLQSPYNTDSLYSIYSYDGIHCNDLGNRVEGAYVYSHVTWTPQLNNIYATLGVQGDSAKINQNVCKNSNPTFLSINGVTLTSGNRQFGNVGIGSYQLLGTSNAANGPLLNNTTGINNFAEGYSALNTNTVGSNNIALGYESMFSDSSASYNVAIGYGALFGLHGTGTYNSAFNYEALYHNTTGHDNFAAGQNACFDNTTGADNVAIGYEALYTNTSNNGSIAIGHLALFSNTATLMTAIGYAALQNNSTGTGNLAVGYNVLHAVTTNSYNTGVGSGTQPATTGSYNTSIGGQSMNANTTGFGNTVSGYQALFFNVSGSCNIAIGKHVLYNSLGSFNTALGDSAGYTNTTGTFNTLIGYKANVGANNLTNATALGNGAVVAASNQIILGNASVKQVLIGGGTYCITSDTVTVGSSGGTASSTGKELLIIKGGGGTTITVNAPSSPVDNQLWSAHSIGGYTTPTFANGTFEGAPTVLTAKTTYKFVYSAALLEWINY